MKVAAIQMVSTGALDDNLAQAASAVCARPHAQGAELAVLPEYFLHDWQKRRRQAGHPGALRRGARCSTALRRTRAIGSVAGGRHTAARARTSAERVFNSSLAFDPQGVCVARYDKMHLFRV